MRTLARIAVLVVLVSTPARADWKKAYFGQTSVGSWATYTLKGVGSPSSILLSTRLPDKNGSVELEDQNTFPGKENPNSTQRYLVAPGFHIERDLIDYPKSLVSFSSSFDGKSFETMPAAAAKSMKEMSPAFGQIAVFANTETVNGMACDHYTYTIKHAAANQTETGDLWLSDTVPFGVVKRTATSKDQSGKVAWTLEMIMTDSGKTPKASATVGDAPEKKAAPKKGTAKPAPATKKKPPV